MTRATNIIKLLEAGGLEPVDVSTSNPGGKRKPPKPGGGGDLKKSPGFEYGSGTKSKQKGLADAEYDDNDVDTPVLVGNMFKRNRSKDLISMTGLRG
jgi:hypothetical protein